LVKAIEENFPGCQWQRCQVHFKKNMLDKVRNCSGSEPIGQIELI
jgi:transposase-like protein